jgi:hypothetical protein
MVYFSPLLVEVTEIDWSLKFVFVDYSLLVGKRRWIDSAVTLSKTALNRVFSAQS